MSAPEDTAPRHSPWWALAIALVAVGLLVWPFLSEQRGSTLGLYVASAGIPIAFLLAVADRVGVRASTKAVVGGAVIGMLTAVLGHGLVGGLAFVAVAGLADSAIEVLDALRIDPSLTAVAGSPWTLVLLVDLVLVAPLTEETGKAIGGALSWPSDRRSAFLAGVAAGTGFAIVENIGYATIGFLGIGEAVLLARMLGVAVHPLASGIIVMGWWEYRQHGDLGQLSRRFAAGVAVHAVWNGSLVALAVASDAYDLGSTGEMGALQLAYTAALGAAAAAATWWLATRVAADGSTGTIHLTDARAIGIWTVVAASTVVPVAVLLLARPPTA